MVLQPRARDSRRGEHVRLNGQQVPAQTLMKALRVYYRARGLCGSRILAGRLRLMFWLRARNHPLSLIDVLFHGLLGGCLRAKCIIILSV
jgi:hypothetical protein